MSKVALLGHGKYQKEQSRKYGEPSPCSVDMANRFILERVKRAPLCGIGLIFRLYSSVRCSLQLFHLYYHLFAIYKLKIHLILVHYVL